MTGIVKDTDGGKSARVEPALMAALPIGFPHGQASD